MVDMARQGRGLITEIFKNLIESLKPRRFRGTPIGKDHLGNEYFEISEAKHGTRGRPSRYYVPKGNDTSKFDEGVPVEWEAWLRLRRNEPPTEEEIDRNLALIALKKDNALKLENKFHPIDSTQPEQKKIGSFPKYDDMEIYPGKKPDN